MWNSLLHLSTLDSYCGLDKKIVENTEQWKERIKTLNFNELPEPYNNLPLFTRLLLINTVRPDLFI